MHSPTRCSVHVLLTAVLVTCAATSFGQLNLQYQNRGGYNEGVLQNPVSAYDIELVVAMAAYSEPAMLAPGALKVRFNLDVTQPVFLTVRDLSGDTGYRLDNFIQPPQIWQRGFNNVFEWSTANVILSLSSLDMKNLGVLIRLGDSEPGDVETVAPAILYHSDAPQTVEAYRFTFKARVGVGGTISIVGPDASTVHQQPIPETPAGGTFAAVWSGALAEDGPYTLVLHGSFRHNGAGFHREVHFLHRRHVAD